MKFKKQTILFTNSLINVIYKSVYRRELTSLHKSTYKNALEIACDQEKNSNQSCRKFVDKYFEKIYARDLIDFGPSYCVDIGACSAKKADLNENVYVL